MSAQSKLEEFIRRLIQQELDEATSTASVGNDSYKTPFAFSDKRKKGKLSDISDVKVRFSRYSSGKIWKADITLNFKNNKQYSIPVFDLHKLETPVKMKDLRIYIINML